jgi:transcriptional regulator with XRE-family HTH domain
MDYYGKSQTDMQRMCDWSKASASQIYNGKQDYSPKLVNEAAGALNLEPFELLMHPDRAMAYRRFRETALTIVADNTTEDPRNGTVG